MREHRTEGGSSRVAVARWKALCSRPSRGQKLASGDPRRDDRPPHVPVGPCRATVHRATRLRCHQIALGTPPPTPGRSLGFAGSLPLIMSEGAVTVRTKKFITNRLLQRKQFVRRCRSMLDHTRRAHATGGEESHARLSEGLLADELALSPCRLLRSFTRALPASPRRICRRSCARCTRCVPHHSRASRLRQRRACGAAVGSARLVSGRRIHLSGWWWYSGRSAWRAGRSFA